MFVWDITILSRAFTPAIGLSEQIASLYTLYMGSKERENEKVDFQVVITRGHT